ncbi:MAG: CSS-motif domain-containing protein, partial [Hyphomicrobiales bacterium]|nr:CSS-motif domain-containing protein [Hyphomicrobiales bacterium]
MRIDLWRTVLITIGLLITGLLVGGGQWLIMKNARYTSERTLQSISERMLQHAETALDEALTALTQIALHGVAKCDQASVDLMRRTVYLTYSVKQIGLMTADGSANCNHLGQEDNPAHPISDLFESRNRSVHFQAVEFAASRSTGTMLVWQQGDGSVLTAIVSGRALAIDILPDIWRTSGIAIIRLDDGTLLGYSDRVPGQNHALPVGARSITATAKSGRYPISVEVVVPFEAVWLEYVDLYTYAQIGGFILAIFVIALTILATRTDGNYV